MENLTQVAVDNALQKGADYADVRIQKMYATNIEIKKSSVEKISFGVISGAGVRVLSGGVWGFASTNVISREELLHISELSVKLAKLKRDTKKKIELEEVKVIEDYVPLQVKIDPRNIPFDEKVEAILEFYGVANGVASGYDKRVIDVGTRYNDSIDHRIFRSSEGAYVEMELPIIAIGCNVTSREGDISRSGGGGERKSRGFEFIKEVDPEEKAQKAVGMSIDLLEGKRTPSGRLPVVMEPHVVGLFIHEAFGHANEADSVLQGRSFLSGKIGEKIASDYVSISSDATMKHEVGSYPYDDEGTPSNKTVLIENGIFKSYMHSRETAAKYKVKPTGNARAEDYSFEPIVRMNNLYVERADWNLEEIIKETKYGIFVKRGLGGTEDPEKGAFQFNVGNCYLIEKGEITTPLRDTSLTGNTIESLRSIDAVGKNFNLKPCTCGKGEPVMQMLPVADGGPSLRVCSIIVGGSF